MDIVVIGAGVAGMVSAISAAKAGHKVRVVEAAAEITYIGAGIQVSPNSSKVLRKLGIDKYIEKYVTEPVDLKMMRWQDGKVLVECPLKAPAHEVYESPYWHIHRADLHRGFLECASDLGIKVYLNSRVVEVDPDGPRLTTKDGKQYTADLVIASDGLHSICRGVVLGKPSPPVPTGQMVYRITVPTSKLEGYPELSDLIITPRNNHWIGRNGTILSYLLEGINDKLINFVFTCDVNMPDGINQKIGDNKEVRASFQGWDSRIDKILEQADTVLEWRLYIHNEMPTWVHNAGKLCLIGDACHAMAPYLAQGAAMGIEDAAILGGLLAKYPSKDTLHEALLLYEKLRLPRVTKVANESIKSRYFTQMADGPEQWERDEYLLSHPGIQSGHRNNRSNKEFLDELFGYDAYKVLETAKI